MTITKQNDLMKKFFNSNDLMGPFDDMVKTFFGKDDSIDKKSTGLVNVSESENGYKLEFILPGYKKEDIKIEINDKYLLVYSLTSTAKENKSKTYIRKEFATSSFSRTFILPDNYSDNIKAEMADGILNISIDKIKKEEKNKTKVININ